MKWSLRIDRGYNMLINGIEYKSVWWEDGSVCLIDQNLLPFAFQVVKLNDFPQVIKAIRDMTVRGAPAIGAAGAFAMALAVIAAPDDKFRSSIRLAHDQIIAARPTAIDLNNGVSYVYENALRFIPDNGHCRQVAVLAATEFVDRSEHDCRILGAIGEPLIPDGARILTHCNAGALATVDWGTALAVIRVAHRKGKRLFVYVSETRPRLQGARLTAFELQQEGIEHAIITDSAAGYYFWKNEIDLMITGADRICLNGDIANKIGTYDKAVLAKEHKIPFYVAAPQTTFDLACMNGKHIPIEYRSPEEITRFGDCQLSNPDSPAFNPAFDITPARLITAFITSKGIFKPKEAAHLIHKAIEN